MAAELHGTLLPRAGLNETHLPRRKPEQHLVPHSGVKAQIEFDMRRERNEEIHDTEREEWESCLFSMCRDHAIVAAEIARRDAINIKLELVGKDDAKKAHQYNLTMTHLIYDGRPTTYSESCPMSTIPTEELVSAKAI